MVILGVYQKKPYMQREYADSARDQIYKDPANMDNYKKWSLGGSHLNNQHLSKGSNFMKNFILLAVLGALTTFTANAGVSISVGHHGGGHYGGGNYGGGYNTGHGCRADMVTRVGRVIQSFQAPRCQGAMRQCQRELSRRQAQGLNRRATCRTGAGGHTGGGYGGGHNNQSRVCYVDRISSYGQHIMTHSGHANGYNAMNQACTEALNKCRRAKSYDQRCRRRN